MRAKADIIAERIARNDAAFRAANEQIRERVEQHARPTRIPFLCECAQEDCTEIVWVSPEEYERIRADPRLFFNAAGHDRQADYGAEVVSEEPGYVIVEKQGRAAEVVEELDPRKEDAH